MKILKILGIILLVLVAAYLVLCFLGPKRINTTQSMEMEAYTRTVYNHVANLEKWELWSPFHKMDPEMRIIYGDITEGKGAFYSWNGKKAGKGRQEIVDAQPYNSLTTQLEFNNNGDYSYGNWTFENLEGKKTRVTWNMQSAQDLPFLTRGFMKLMNFETILNNQFQNGLTNLKELVEGLPQMPVGLKEFEAHGTNYMGIRRIVNTSEEYMNNFIQESMNTTAEYMGEKMQSAGVPTCLYYFWDENNNSADMAAAFPVQKKPALGTPQRTKQTDAGDILIFDSKIVMDIEGSYDQLRGVHEAMTQWLQANNKDMIPPCLEEYPVDPETVTDESELKTRIIYYYQ